MKVRVVECGGADREYEAPFIQLERDPNDGSYTLNLHDEQLEPTGFACYAKDAWLFIELLELPSQPVREVVQKRRAEQEQQANNGTGMHL